MPLLTARYCRQMIRQHTLACGLGACMLLWLVLAQGPTLWALWLAWISAWNGGRAVGWSKAARILDATPSKRKTK